ncbi:Miniconductance mechanosensitive channel MscM precursor [compost metagenome]
MCNALQITLRILCLLLGLSAGLALAAEGPLPLPLPIPNYESASLSASDLQELQARLDSLKQQISVTSNYNQLIGLQDVLQQLIRDVNTKVTLLLPEQTQLQAQLEVLGPAPPAGAAPEEPAIALQRAQVSGRKNHLDADLKALDAIKTGAGNLTLQLASIRRNQLEAELALRSGSILGASFWAPLIHPVQEDRQRFAGFMAQVAEILHATWQPGLRAGTAGLLLLALAVWTLGRRLVERALTWWCIHWLPEGRLRRSSLAITVTLTTVLTTLFALHLVVHVLARPAPLPMVFLDYLEEVERIAFTCVMITGLSRALLSTGQPSWRLPAISDPVALVIKPYPRILAGVLMVMGSLVQVTNLVGMSTSVAIFGRGVVALVATLVIGILLLRTSHVRREVALGGEAPEARTTLAGLMYIGATIVIVLAACCLVIGYITLARFLTYELVWVFIVLASFYLLSQLIKDACDNAFSPRSASGKALKQLVGVGDERLEQTAIVLSGASRALLLLLAVIALFVGGVGSTLGQLANTTLAILGGEGLRKLNIIPEHLLNAMLGLAVGVYVIRSLGRWLDRELLPKTEMDPGMRASLSTLFSNVGYVVVILLSLSILGIKWNSLAWIVSALSVGIGFGLQEIVKNFVSGIILLTERPVKVGDLVSISGVEGDIRRINVRATEIQLADRSIVIVPNSQLISQNLRNVTLGGSAQGVATLELMFALDIDPEQVKELLLGVYQEQDVILERPAPFVRFSQLTPDGITLTVTGYVASPRIVALTKSELLFEILKRLGAAGIALAKPKDG